jgi:hypothetical protein
MIRGYDQRDRDGSTAKDRVRCVDGREEPGCEVVDLAGLPGTVTDWLLQTDHRATGVASQKQLALFVVHLQRIFELSKAIVAP